MKIIRKIFALLRSFFTLRMLAIVGGSSVSLGLVIAAAVFVIDNEEGGLREQYEHKNFKAYVDSSFTSLDNEWYRLSHQQDELAITQHQLAARALVMRKEISTLRELIAYFKEKEKE